MSKRTQKSGTSNCGDDLKKLAVSGLLVGGFVIYSLAHGRANAAALGDTTPASTSSNTASSTATAGTTPATDTTPSATATGQYKDGAYTGPITDAQWGYVQVKVVVSGGKMASVQFVQYPNDRSRSIMINQYADPILDQEAIQAQSANVDIVTGATDSSYAFMQSLGDALNQAQG